MTVSENFHHEAGALLQNRANSITMYDRFVRSSEQQQERQKLRDISIINDFAVIALLAEFRVIVGNGKH